MTKTINKQVVRLANGHFVQDWQYSQGHFDYAVCTEAWEARHITQEHFEQFFQRETGAELVGVEMVVKVTDVIARI